MNDKRNETKTILCKSNIEMKVTNRRIVICNGEKVSSEYSI